MAKIFKDHFKNILESLHTERPCKVDFGREPIATAIKNFSQHPSILKIKENTNFSACFSFRTVSSKSRGSTLSTKQFRPHKNYAKV